MSPPTYAAKAHSRPALPKAAATEVLQQPIASRVRSYQFDCFGLHARDWEYISPATPIVLQLDEAVPSHQIETFTLRISFASFSFHNWIMRIRETRIIYPKRHGNTHRERPTKHIFITGTGTTCQRDRKGLHRIDSASIQRSKPHCFLLLRRPCRMALENGEFTVSKRCAQNPNYATDGEKTAMTYSNRLEVDIVLIL
jgi:hypothetical protein